MYACAVSCYEFMTITVETGVAALDRNLSGRWCLQFSVDDAYHLPEKKNISVMSYRRTMQYTSHSSTFSSYRIFPLPLSPLRVDLRRPGQSAASPPE
jgi:hypothetical protein